MVRTEPSTEITVNKLETNQIKSDSIDVGTAIISGGQIKFPAIENPSADANTLDDYEEGDWTPGIAFDGGTTDLVYSIRTGKYTKIGRQVTVTGYILLSAKGSSVGNAAITGLPFTIYNSSSNYSVPNMRFSNISFADQYAGYGVIGANTIRLYQTTNAGVGTFLTNANFADNSSIIFLLTYFVS